MSNNNENTPDFDLIKSLQDHKEYVLKKCDNDISKTGKHDFFIYDNKITVYDTITMDLLYNYIVKNKS